MCEVKRISGVIQDNINEIRMKGLEVISIRLDHKDSTELLEEFNRKVTQEVVKVSSFLGINVMGTTRKSYLTGKDTAGFRRNFRLGTMEELYYAVD